MTRFLLGFAVVWSFLASAAFSIENVVVYPQNFDATCRNGDAKLYDECGDQFAILKEAVEEAKKTGKVVIVSYGAEWCIWCHALDAHLKGQYGMFNYEVEGYPPVMAESLGANDQKLADELNAFAARNVVFVHIEGLYAPNGAEVLSALGADQDYKGSIPYLFSIKDGRIAKIMVWKPENDPKEKRRDGFLLYRGYNREPLLDELKQLVEATR